MSMQADLLVQCMHTILAAGLHLPSLAVSTLLGCFEVDKLATLLQKQDQQQHRANAEQVMSTRICMFLSKVASCQARLVGWA